VTEQPLNVNFLRYRPGTRLRIPVVYINDDSSVDMKRGSYLVHINRFKYMFNTDNGDTDNMHRVLDL
jgi:hypothetical protein